MSQSTSQERPVDLFEQGIASWAQRVRSGELTFLQTTQSCLDNVADNKALNAFEHINEQLPLIAAAAMDSGGGFHRELLMDDCTQKSLKRTKLKFGLHFERADTLYQLCHDGVRIFETSAGSFWLVLQRHR